jgi:hypothetical protein
MVPRLGRRRLRWPLVGAMIAALALCAPDPALAMSVYEVVARFEDCGFQVGETQTVYAVDGSPTTFFRVWTEDEQRGTRGLVVYVYDDEDAADDVFHALASVDKLAGVELEPTLDNGPLLEHGVGRSVWRGNVAVAQIMPLTSPTDLDAVPDADLVRCLDDAR